MDPSVVARLDAVHVDRHRVTILRELDLVIVAGEVVGVLGSNGSGKSTLLEVLATLVRPTSGTVELFGRRLDASGRRAVRPRIGLVGHTAALYDRLTLAENLRLIARLVGEPDERADAVLAQVGLERAADRLAVACSQGMRRRADLARVLLTRPGLVLLDEVHAGLDRDAAPLVDDVVRTVAGRDGTACVLVSHDPDRLVGLCDRLVRVRSGRVEAEEPA